jgi:hypothetical protein
LFFFAVLLSGAALALSDCVVLLFGGGILDQQYNIKEQMALEMKVLFGHAMRFWSGSQTFAEEAAFSCKHSTRPPT